MKSIITLIIILLGIGFTFAQEVTLDDKKYQVDDKTIWSNGTDVTNVLNEEQQQKIFDLAEVKRKELKQIELEQKASEKSKKQAEKQSKQLKKLEKQQKKTQKALKKKENVIAKKAKAEKQLTKAEKEAKKVQSKYEKLSKKGKLSTEDEAKWLKKN